MADITYKPIIYPSQKRRRHFFREQFIPKIFLPLFRYCRDTITRTREDRKALKHSDILIKKHRGQDRCFVLGNGPSLQKQDLSALKNETTIVCNFFNLHPQCEQIAPKYYAIFDMAFFQRSGLEEQGVEILRDKWTKEVAEKLPNTEFIANLRMRPDMENKTEFKSRNIWYFESPVPILPGLKGRFQEHTVDLHPSQNVVPDCTLRLALKMGFKKIYLLGCDANWLEGKEGARHLPSHFYNANPFLTKPPGFSTMVTELDWLYSYFKTMEALKQIALGLGVEIINLTEGGILDVFPRQRLTDVVKVRDAG